MLPWDITMHPSRFRSGTIGPVILSGVPLLIMCWRNLPAWKTFGIAFALISLPIWYFSYLRVRVYLTVLFVFILLIVCCLEYYLKNGNKLFRWSAIIIVGAWFSLGVINNFRYHHNPIKAVLCLVNSEEYLDKELRKTKFDWYYDFKHLNSILPENANVLIWDERGYHLKRKYTWIGGLTRGMATHEEMLDPGKLINLLERLGITHTAWHPYRETNKEATVIAGKLIKTGRIFPYYSSNTIVVYRLEY
jgi:hypothetical protein